MSMGWEQQPGSTPDANAAVREDAFVLWHQRIQENAPPTLISPTRGSFLVKTPAEQLKTHCATAPA